MKILTLKSLYEVILDHIISESFPLERNNSNKLWQTFPTRWRATGAWHINTHMESHLTELDLNLSTRVSRNRCQNRTCFWRLRDSVWSSLWSPLSHRPPTALSKVVYLKSITGYHFLQVISLNSTSCQMYFHPCRDNIVWLPGTQVLL